ncbi:hypothetical protein HMPREF9999_00281 [Alloprevotella sp. oral taxon 473 str. F0040]|nr:hypothetical protein HMPREF9999_00281 [Alloprevotella sp. oral taxon 473 str. F0040]
MRPRSYKYTTSVAIIQTSTLLNQRLSVFSEDYEDFTCQILHFIITLKPKSIHKI